MKGKTYSLTISYDTLHKRKKNILFLTFFHIINLI